MYPFTLPDYKGRSIVNLMSSIAKSFGKSHSYKELDCLKAKDLKQKDVVLIAIDGLGYKFLTKHKDSFLYKHMKQSITSTFLSTTACANTVFLVGYPPQQHALTGWDIQLKELGAVTTVLRFRPRIGGEDLSEYGVVMGDLTDISPFRRGFKGRCYTLMDKKISGTEFTRYTSDGSEIIPTSSYADTFIKLNRLLKKRSKQRRFIHAYIYEFDSMTHMDGTRGKHTKSVFLDLDKKVRNLAQSLKGKDVKIVITADHGLLDCKKKHNLWVDDFKGLNECLTTALSGEGRARYCYVRPSKVHAFERIVKTKLSKYCWCYRSEKVIRDHLYGLGKPNKRLLDRAGDYILVMKGDYVLSDRLANMDPKRSFHIGRHGGVTDDEMLVPLIVIEP